MIKRLGDFLSRLGCGDQAILAEVPQERPRFATMGTALLTTAGLAALSMFYALHDGVRADLAWSLILCLIWGLVILNIDRLLVASMGTVRSAARLVLMVLPRLLLFAVIAVVTATPLVVRIFSADVARQLLITHSRQPLAANNGLLAEVQALSQLSGSNTAVEVTLDVTFLLFFLILLLPVSAKILLSLGPPGAYEQVARCRDEQVTDAARQARIVSRRIAERETGERLRIEEIKGQARIAIEEDMRQKQEDLGRRANTRVAHEMEAILDAALHEWSNQVRSTLAAPGKSAQAVPAFNPEWPPAAPPQPEARPDYGVPADDVWASTEPLRPEARPGYDLPAGDEL
jgi:hypothetical protein